ncbi:MAG: rhodanese-like domain-containing protein [Pseudomonadota bacterium]
MYGIDTVDARQVDAWMQAGEPMLLVDVRTPAETAQGIIPGARLLPLHLVPMNVEAFRGAPRIVVCCHSGARSAQACYFLAQQGISSVYNLGGGMISWMGSGLPVERPGAASALLPT